MAADEQLGKLAQELMKTPLVTNAATAAFGAREKATQAQEAMMSALNVPSAADVEKLNKRLRSLSTRLEGIEDLLDARLGAIEQRLAAIEKSLLTAAKSAE
jgi:polyhydroxyalkanoate synthesis regulator phasin